MWRSACRPLSAVPAPPKALNTRFFSLSSWRCLALLCVVTGQTVACALSGNAGDSIRIALAGDSTVAHYATWRTKTRGWGQLLPEFFDLRHTTIRNFALPEASTKTFVERGQWNRVLASGPTYIFIQFGHNDSHGQGHRESTEPKNDFDAYLRHFVESARAVGAIPVLVTPMHRAVWLPNEERLTQELLPYADAIRSVAENTSVPLVDLNGMTRSAFEEIGPRRLADLLAFPVADRTHFNEAGARLLAALVSCEAQRAISALRSLVICGAEMNLRHERWSSSLSIGGLRPYGQR